MPKGAKQLPALGLLLLLPLLAFISSCENDLNKVRQISASLVDTAVERTTGVDLILSDSGRIQFRIQAPLLVEYQIKKPYKLMPKGIKIIFYDKITNEPAGTITADTGIFRSGEKLVEFHKNVVATNTKGDTFKSEELYWDQVTKKVYSHKHVDIVMSSGNLFNGDSFESDDKFLTPSIEQTKGTIHVDEKNNQ